MRPQITARRCSRTKVESECFAYTRSAGVLSIVGSPLYRTAARERCCARSRCTYVAVVRTYVRLFYCAFGTERSYVMCFGRILISAMARARHKRTRSTDNTIHVSGMADRRAAYTFDIFLAYLHLSWPFLLLLFSSHPGLTGMCVSESNHGE